MKHNWRQRLLSGWSFMRFIRLGLGIVLLMEGSGRSDLLFVMLGAIVLLLAVLNIGCFGAGNCGVNTTKREVNSTSQPIETTTFKEIK